MLPSAIQRDRGEPARVRIGEVINGDIVLQGVVLQDVGILDSYSPANGDTVALLGQSSVGTSGSSWLALGRVAPDTDPPINKTIGVISVATDGQTATTGLFADILSGGVPISLSYTKQRDASDLVIHFYASCFALLALSTVQFGINANGTDFNTTFFFFNPASEHHAMSSVHKLAGISSGPVTLTARWFRGGVGNISMDTNDRVSFSVEETM